MRRINVLVIDDSAVTRQVLSKLISTDPELYVIDTAIDAVIASKKIEKLRPDVITLDLELPRMDGITFLKQLMATAPIPVVVISSVSEHGSRNAIDALSAGAVEVISKPDISCAAKVTASAQMIHEAIKAAFDARLNLRPTLPVQRHSVPRRVDRKDHSSTSSTKVIAIGASTGGTEAIASILTQLPVNCPGVLIVQHMPEMFTRSFAERLNSICNIRVKEAEDNDEVMDGVALIAPGNKHMELSKRNGKFVVALHEGEKVNRHRPSVDVLFTSIAQQVGAHVNAMLLTGMGEDGAAGLLKIRRSGGNTIAQDKGSSIVFGMPRRAIELGAACEVLSLQNIPDYVRTKISSL